MSAIDETIIDCPLWCQSSRALRLVGRPHKPEHLHSVTRFEGNFSIKVDQHINLDGTSTGEPILARLEGIDGLGFSELGCHALAGALLDTARYIEAATVWAIRHPSPDSTTAVQKVVEEIRYLAMLAEDAKA